MKICMIASGTFDHVQPYIEYFQNKGDEVYFIALSPSPNRNVKTFKCWFGNNSLELGKPTKWKYLISALLARNQIRKINPDIVHAHFATSGGLAAWLTGHPNTIISVHGTDLNKGIKSKIWKLLLRKFFNFAKVIHVVSKALKIKVMELGISERKIFTINIGIDTQAFKRVDGSNNISFKSLNILCNRSFDEVYDHLTILKSLVILKQRNISFSLTLIGDGALKEKLKDFVSQNDLDSNVFFLGRIPYEDQIFYFHNNSIYVSASLSDGTSLSLLEAMASGLFPVVTNIEANQDWIRHGENGLLFPVKDSQTLATMLEKLFLDQTNLNYVSKNLEIIEMYGDRIVNMNQINRIYQSLISINIV